MPTEYYTENEVRKARKKVKLKKAFFYHLSIYFIVIAFLICINIFSSPNDIWFQYPALSWGLAILIHGLATFGVPGINKAWEEKAIDKELRKIDPTDEDVTMPEDELELKEFRKLRKEWDDSDFV